MRFFFFASLFVALGASASTTRFQGFVEIEPGRSLYVDWKKADPGRPTLVLLNGLTYTTKNWQAMTDLLQRKGYGIFRYDPVGMGETLEKDGPVKQVIRIEEQARDLDLVTTAAGLGGPLNLVGLSYGGGLAIAFARDFSHRIRHAILMAPYTEPVASQDELIRNQIRWTRATFPGNPATDDDLYGFFLRQQVYTTYPISEPSMLDSPLKLEAVFQMIQGVRKFDMKKAAGGFPRGSVSLLIAEWDQYIQRAVLEKFWNSLPASSRGEKMLIERSEHKIPEAQPGPAVEKIKRILARP